MIGNILVTVILATFFAASIEASPGLEPCSQLDQLKPDSKNCSRFYECTLAGWVGNACNPGLEFNPATLYCDYPENVKCANETSIRNVGLEPCSQVNQLKPDSKNCSRFYECTLAGWVGNACNPGLEFNPATLYCDYPENVKCANETSIRNDLKLEPCTELDKLIPDPQNCSRFFECTLNGWVGLFCYPGLEFNPVTLQCDYPENVKCPNETIIGDLKLEPCMELDKLIPDPQNCSRFYECTLNGWVGLFCYPGLEFNPVTLQCDYPENVKCPNETIIAGKVPTYEPCTIVDELKPDPKNCSRFYECIEAGYWIGEPCNVGLLFNPDTLQCDYPENVKCATEIQDKEMRGGPYCGPLDYGRLFADPWNSNCTGFLECSPVGLVHFDCPSNLRFNPVTSVCDWPWKVKCNVS